MAARPRHLLSLCDGYGGTELALRSVVPVRTVCRVERDAYAAAVLVARMEEQRLDQAPVWDDVCTFDGAAWRGRVDIVAAGFPCQPFSAAGKRGGVDDERWLWPAIERIIADVRPGYVLVENVPQLVRHGLPEVLHGLAALGFDAEWGLYSAAAVGAPHRRERLWLVAWSDRDGFGRQFASEAGGGWFAADDDDGCGTHVGHAGGPRRSEVPRGALGDEGQDGRQPHRGDLVDGASEAVADTSSVGRWGQGFGPATQERPGWIADVHASGEGMGWPPGPDDRDGWERWIAAGGPEPVIRRSTDGPPVGLADALHLGGNGLVPQCAAEAWSQLIRRAGWHDQLKAV